MLMAFDSTQQALRAEMLLEYAKIEIDIQPTPKEITAGCAISIGFDDDDLVKYSPSFAVKACRSRGFSDIKTGNIRL